jgi:hypothetical protein
MHCEIQGITDRPVRFGAPASFRIADHDGTGRNADAQAQFAAQPISDTADRAHQIKAGQDRTFDIILSRFRVAEIDEQAGAEEMDKPAVERGENTDTFGPNHSDHFAQIFRIVPP